MEELKITEIKNLLIASEINKKMSQYQIISEFLKQVGSQLYLKQMVGQTPTTEDIKIFTDELNKFKELTEKLCSLSVTKA